jgi:hypothetical protein
MREVAFSWIGRPKLIVGRLRVIPIKISVTFFVEIEWLFPELKWEFKGPIKAKTVFKRNKGTSNNLTFQLTVKLWSYSDQ